MGSNIKKGINSAGKCFDRHLRVRDNIQLLNIPSTFLREHGSGLYNRPCHARQETAADIFGQRMFALRKARGLTQIDLAKALGTTQRVISYYETGAPLPSASFLVALAQTLAVTTDELLGARPAKLKQEKPQRRRLWKRFQRMESLPERDQRAVIRLINSLVASNGNGQSRGSAHP